MAAAYSPEGVLVADLPEFADGLFEAHRYKVLWGGRGKGASWSMARALLIRAAAETARVGCFRELQTSIKDSVHRLLADQIDLLGLRGFTVTQTEIRHRNGSFFLFAGLRHNVTKVKSMEGLDVAWVEEAEHVSEASWRVLVPTIRKAGSEIWVSFNPDLETDATSQRFLVHPPPDAWVRKVSADDNPWFPEELAREREHDYRVDPDAAAHIWGGEYRQASDAQILRGKWRVDRFEPDESWGPPLQGADFGFAQDPTTLVRSFTDGRRLFVERESYKIGLELDHTVARWEADVPGFAAYVTRADSARPESISYLRRHGAPRIEGVAKWQGSVEDGIAYLRQFDEIVIHERCRHTITEARHYSYKVDERTGDVLPQIVDKHNHTIDPIRYALAPLIRGRGIRARVA